jgi:hypothetical protein
MNYAVCIWPKSKNVVFLVATQKKLRVGWSILFSSNFIFNACFTTGLNLYKHNFFLPRIVFLTSSDSESTSMGESVAPWTRHS